MTTADKNKTAIEIFMIETLAINPIKKIIDQIENKEMRDCDIEFLNKKLKCFTQVALDVIGVKIRVTSIVRKDSFLNAEVKTRFLQSFKTLLTFYEKQI